MKGGKNRAPWRLWRTHLRWIEPGLGVKRWLLLMAFGIALFSLSSASLLRSMYPLPAYFYYLTLQFIPRGIRVAVFFLAGASSLVAGIWGLNRALIAPLINDTDRPYAELLYEYRRKGKGPHIVVLGGGHGQAAILRGLKAHTKNLTAIVTVADDGGSSGRLRRELGVLPPGDFRNCIAALADDESLVTRLLQYRFRSKAGLDGHSFGNLYISAMSGVTGSFESALEESSHVLAVQGRVLPSTLQAITLAADVQIGNKTPTRIRGESEIPATNGRIIRVLLEPDSPRAYPGVVRAILDADLIIVGPGSLYTSIMPNLLVPEIAQALRASRAPKVYVCNIATQHGETDDYTAEDHLQALERHLGTGLFSVIIVNEQDFTVAPPANSGWVLPQVLPREGVRVVKANLGSKNVPWQHESAALARTVIRLLK
ncbi:MAG: YvcK family protein [Anaerolineae bacterium]|nr:YvcK family protein [Anaerolineae bacterium]